jgi:hypothetical protein
MSPQGEQNAANAESGDLCLCSSPNGLMVTAPDDCRNNQHGTCVEKGVPDNPQHLDAVIPYTLPSGNKVVGTFANLMADRGSLADRYDPREMPSDYREDDPVVCRLPSGITIIETRAQCREDRGTAIGKLN